MRDYILVYSKNSPLAKTNLRRKQASVNRRKPTYKLKNYDVILNMWAAGALQRIIQKKLGYQSKCSINKVLARGRRLGDPRAARRPHTLPKHLRRNIISLGGYDDFDHMDDVLGRE